MVIERKGEDLREQKMEIITETTSFQEESLFAYRVANAALNALRSLVTFVRTPVFGCHDIVVLLSRSYFRLFKSIIQLFSK